MTAPIHEEGSPGTPLEVSPTRRAVSADAGQREYKELFDANPYPTWVYGRHDYSFLAVNQSAIDSYGYTEAEFLGMTILDIRPQGEVETLVQSRSTESGGSAGIWTHRKRDGSLIEVEIHVLDIEFRGVPARIVTAIDVTERLRIQDSLFSAQARLSYQSRTLVELAKLESLTTGDFPRALRAITEAGSRVLDVERAGVWLFDASLATLVCADLFDRSTGEHTSGSTLEAASYPTYFRALEEERTITAHDARRDSRTAEFEEYYRAFGIHSMLDAPIRYLSRLSGIVCHEHVGKLRHWHPDEESFTASMADLVSIAMQAADKRQTEESLRRHIEFEKTISTISTRFVNLEVEHVDESILQSLSAIAGLVEADRSYVFTFSPDLKTASQSYEWCAEGVAATSGDLQDLPASDFPWTMRHLISGIDMVISDVDQLPEEAAPEKGVNLAQGTHSLVLVPMTSAGHLLGFAGFDSLIRREWPADTVVLLRLAGEIFASALSRKRTEGALRESEEQFRTLVERMREGLVRAGTDHRIEFVNDRFCEMVDLSREELLGRDVRELFVDEDQPLLDAQTERRLLGLSDRFQARIRRGSEGLRWLEIGEAPVHDSSGKLLGTIGVLNDVTERKVAEESLRDSEARYRLMAQHSTDMIARHSVDGTYLYASPASQQLLGYAPEELIGQLAFDFIHPDDVRGVQRFVSQLVDHPVALTISYRTRRSNGTFIWFETTIRSVRDEDGNIVEMTSVSRDITQRKMAEEHIEYQAYHDSLTDLPNRTLFSDRLTVALAHARRVAGQVGVLFLDLDHFKLLNDTFGHSVGDRMLQEIGRRIRATVREEDTVARMGGDEFTLILSDLPSADAAAFVAQKLLDAVSQRVTLDGQDFYPTTSIGIAIYPSDGGDGETLLKNADAAMYQAKELGRNAYQLCTAAMNRRALERLSLENRLRRAVREDEFVVHYQPLIRLSDLEATGVEALVRWEDPERGLVPPGDFIWLAEETRMILPIGDSVLRQAARQAEKWRRNGHPDLRLNVNLSPRQFQQKNLTASIASILAETGLHPSALELEITENTAMQSTAKTLDTLRQLREMGILISIDDFGTGHSSLSYLTQFSIDCLKIDRSFVIDVDTNPHNAAIVSALIAMARGLGIRVIAEGVERQEQLDFLIDQKCDEVQGYLLQRPVAAEMLTLQNVR